MHNSQLTYLFILSLLLVSCKTINENWREDSNSAAPLHASMKQLTDIIVHDIFSPPQASRIYAYASIAAYEAMTSGSKTYKSLYGQLNEMPPIVTPENIEEICYPLAANIALTEVGKALVFSEEKMTAYVNRMKSDYALLNMPPSIYDASIAHGLQVSQNILAWAQKDNYNETRAFPKFSVTDVPERWKPTPPGYMEGIEPSWNEIRPFTLDSAEQFKPPFPTKYDTDIGSQFYQETVEVYKAVNNATDEHKAIASFWDCNPYVLNVTGHVMHASKKITPGGHWINIVKIACEQSNVSIEKSIEAYTLTSIALADAFISCWDEKYRSNLVRPETVINEKIDPDWLPLLQTPPFPEYTSGHSVISSAAAVVLTSIFGDNFAFADDSEVEYGLPVRNFPSFIAASEEAAVSRLYGGIHYRPAIDNGVTQGRALGKYVVQKIDLVDKRSISANH